MDYESNVNPGSSRVIFWKEKRLMAFDVNSQFLQTGLKNYLNQSIAYF